MVHRNVRLLQSQTNIHPYCLLVLKVSNSYVLIPLAFLLVKVSRGSNYFPSLSNPLFSQHHVFNSYSFNTHLKVHLIAH